MQVHEKQCCFYRVEESVQAKLANDVIKNLLHSEVCRGVVNELFDMVWLNRKKVIRQKFTFFTKLSYCYQRGSNVNRSIEFAY